MRVKPSGTLRLVAFLVLFAMLFGFSASELYAQSRAFDETHIAVSITDPATDARVIIGSTVRVELTDPSIGDPTEVASASVDYSLFGVADEVDMDWDDDISRWVAEYIVVEGTLNDENAHVEVHAAYVGGGGQWTVDDAVFVVNNIAADVNGLTLDIEVEDADDDGKAILGSTIIVKFELSDVDEATADFSDFGGGAAVPFVEDAGEWTAQYLVQVGDEEGTGVVEVSVFVDGNPNPGIVDSDPIAYNNKFQAEIELIGYDDPEVPNDLETGAANLVYSITYLPGAGVAWNDADLQIGYMDDDGITFVPIATVGISGPFVEGVDEYRWNLAIPHNLPHARVIVWVELFDAFDNGAEHYSYFNITPLPEITITDIDNFADPIRVDDNGFFWVPAEGNGVQVTFDVSNIQRFDEDEGLIVTLSNEDADFEVEKEIVIDPLVATYTAEFAYDDIFDTTRSAATPGTLDGKTITVEVSGQVKGFTAVDDDSDLIEEIIDETTFTVDQQPVITDVVFLKPHTDGLTVFNSIWLQDHPYAENRRVVVTVESPNDVTVPTISTVDYIGTDFNYNHIETDEYFDDEDNRFQVFTYRLQFLGLEFEEEEDIYAVIGFEFSTETVSGYPGEDYLHEIVVVEVPDRAVVTGYSPDDDTRDDEDTWFSPRHRLDVVYNFKSIVNPYTNNGQRPPALADFEEIVDDIVLNWRFALPIGEGSTQDIIETITLQQGTEEVDYPLYQYAARWEQYPNVPFIWHHYDDGEDVTLRFIVDLLYNPNNAVPTERTIYVDKQVPVYDEDLLYIAVMSGEPVDGDFQLIDDGFDPNKIITLALTPDGEWPADDVTGDPYKIYLKYRAKDDFLPLNNGSGVADIEAPSVPAGWSVSEFIPADLRDPFLEKIFALTPANPENINEEYDFSVTLGTVIDNVGHYNYGGEINHYDPNWQGSGPELNFTFTSDYLYELEFARAYKIDELIHPDDRWLWDYSAPYVKTEANIGFQMKLETPDVGRGVDVDEINITSIELNTYWVTNTTGTDTVWVELAYDAVSDVWYLDQPVQVSENYGHGDTIKFQYRINYEITYIGSPETTTAYKLSSVIDGLAIVDDQRAGLTSVEIWSESLGYGQEGYVVPGDQEGILQIEFVDVGNYFYGLDVDPDNPHQPAVPTLIVNDLDNFIAGRYDEDLDVVVPMPAAYFVQAEDLEWTQTDGINGIWTATIDNLVIFDPGTFIEYFTYNVNDVVGNGFHNGQRHVRIVANGPIVPFIDDAKLVTELQTGEQVDNYLARISEIPLDTAVDPYQRVEIFIDTEYTAYITEVDVYPADPEVEGLEFVFAGYRTSEFGEPGQHVAMFYALVHENFNREHGELIELVAETQGEPIGQPIFEMTHNFEVIFDDSEVLDFTATEAFVQGSGTGLGGQEWINDVFHPERDMRVVAVFPNLGGMLVDDEDINIDFLNTDLTNWFVLNIDEFGIENRFADDIEVVWVPDEDEVRMREDEEETGTYYATVVWNIPAFEIPLAEDLTEDSYTLAIDYKNIYKLHKDLDIEFYKDVEAPEIVDYKLYYLDADEEYVEIDDAYTDGVFAADQDWSRIRVFFADNPENNAGLQDVMIAFEAYPETYQYDDEYPLALLALNSIEKTNWEIFADGTGYVDLEFVETLEGDLYSGRHLANGLYKVVINHLKDKFDNEPLDEFDEPIEFVQDFLFNYHPADMTINIGGQTSDFALNLSDGPLDIMAYTDSEMGIEGIEFRLYYDDNNLGEDGFDPTNTNLNHHLTGTPDFTFPYTAIWNMDDEAFYAFLDDFAYRVYDDDGGYELLPYRGFYLRASAIVQGRDLFDVIEYIQLVDDVAPVPAPHMDDIVKMINYIYPAQNVLNIPVDFNIIDAEEVKVEIYSNGELIETLVQDVVDPHGTTNLEWDFDGRLPGTYTTAVYGKDISENWSNAVAGPMIYLENAVMKAVVETNVYRFRDTPHEELPLSGDPYLTLGPNFYIDGDTPLIIDDENFIMLEAVIYNTYVDFADEPLMGIESLSFYGEFFEYLYYESFRSRDEEPPVPDHTVELVPNDPTHQPHVGVDGVIPSSIIPVFYNAVEDRHEGRIRLAVPNNIFDGFIAEGEDFEFWFKANIVPIDEFEGIDPPDPANLPFAGFRVDLRAPELAITPVYQPGLELMSWEKPGSFVVAGELPVYDINDVFVTGLQWKIEDEDDWKNAWFDNVVIPDVPDNMLYNYQDWMIMGGAADTFLGDSFEGAVQIRVFAEDEVGNLFESEVVLVDVDNNAPETRFTHAVHPTVDPELYIENTNLALIGQTVHTDNDSLFIYEGENALRLFVEKDGLDADLQPPLHVYFRNVNDPWQIDGAGHGVPYSPNVPLDPWNFGFVLPPNISMYQFTILAEDLPAGEYHFVVAAKDEMENLEGDTASDIHAYTGGLTPDELDAMDYLWIVVEPEPKVITEIVSHNDSDIVGGWINLAATSAQQNIDELHQTMRFERRMQGEDWIEIATIDKAVDSNDVFFHLKKSQIPQFDGLNGDLGIFIYNPANGDLWEMTAEMDDDEVVAWSATLDLPFGNYELEYHLDLNGDGVVNSIDSYIAYYQLGVGVDNSDYDQEHFHILPAAYLPPFVVTEWMYALDTTEITGARTEVGYGLYEIRALPLDIDVPDGYTEELHARELLIDNVTPEIFSFTATASEQMIAPGTEQDFVTSINPETLLVPFDDILELSYQYSLQPADTDENRQWITIETLDTNNMAGLYYWQWDAPIVDHMPEPDTWFYLRIYVRDIAGNYATSVEYPILVKGSGPEMLVDTINEVPIDSENNVFVIPEPVYDDVNDEYVVIIDVAATLQDTQPIVFTHPVTGEELSVEPLMAKFEYQYKESMPQPWSAWTEFDDEFVPVTNGIATMPLQLDPQDLWEGYYRFRVITKDIFDNETAAADAPVTYVIFDALLFSSPAMITQIGNVDEIVPDPADEDAFYTFAQSRTAYQGNIHINLADHDEIASITVEWNQENVDNGWNNIYTTPANQPVIETPFWNPPATFEDDYIYVRVKVHDGLGNSEVAHTVRVFIDTVAPTATVAYVGQTVPDNGGGARRDDEDQDPVIEDLLIANDKTVILNDRDLIIELDYHNLIDNDTINDIKKMEITVNRVYSLSGDRVMIVDPDDEFDRYLLFSETFGHINAAPVSIVIPADDVPRNFGPIVPLSNLPDGIYEIEIWLTDYAGNILLDDDDEPQPNTFDELQELYIDTEPPLILDVVSTSHPNNVAVYNETVQFDVSYLDLIGVPETDAFTVVFSHGDLTQEVNEYMFDEDTGNILFSWTPSPEFVQLFASGSTEKQIDMAIWATDYLGNAIANPFGMIFTLIATDPYYPAKIYVVRDNTVVDGDRDQFVDWTDDEGSVEHYIGTDRTPGEDPFEPMLYSYIPQTVAYGIDNLANVEYRFYYQHEDDDSDDWTLIGSKQGNQFDVGPNVLNYFIQHPALYHHQYSIAWDIVDLPGGNYIIRTVSNYSDVNDLIEEKISDIHVAVYEGTIIPHVVIYDNMTGLNVDVDQVERGMPYRYELRTENFEGDAQFVNSLRYKFRYVEFDANGNEVPVSEWKYFVDENYDNDPMVVDWHITDAPYIYPWYIYDYYTVDAYIKIVGYAKDNWGTLTLLNDILVNEDAYTYAQIVDTTPPMIEDVLVYWTDQDPIDPAYDWVSGALVDVDGDPVDNQVQVKAMLETNVDVHDIDYVEFWFEGVLIATHTNHIPINGELWTDLYAIELPNDPAVLSGMIEVVAYDVNDNASEPFEVMINIDNVDPVTELVVKDTEGNEIDPRYLGLWETVILDAQAYDNESGIAGVQFSFAHVDDVRDDHMYYSICEDELIPREDIGPYAYEFQIKPSYEEGDQARLQNGFVFGEYYVFKAVVVDNVGLEDESMTDEYQVTYGATATILRVEDPASNRWHPNVNNIIPVRLHGDFNIVTQVNVDDELERVEYLLHTENENWEEAMSLDIVDVNGGFANLVINLDDEDVYPADEYYIGVRPRERDTRLYFPVVDYAHITLDRVMDVEWTHHDTVIDFNGEEFVVHFTVLSDDELIVGPDAQIVLEYKIPGVDMPDHDWRALNVGSQTLQRISTTTYKAIFTDIDIWHVPAVDLLNGVLNFRFTAEDKAFPVPNEDHIVMNDIMYDTTPPEAVITSVTFDGEDENLVNNDPIVIPLGSVMELEAHAWDVLYGQYVAVASGIERVEFYYTTNDAPVLPGIDNWHDDWSLIGVQEDGDEMFTQSWNTNGYPLGNNYKLMVVAYDNVGNESAVTPEDLINVNIVVPENLEPYAFVTAMTFDNDVADSDFLYAVSKAWAADDTIDAVVFEYFNGAEWTQFTQAVQEQNLSNNEILWKAQFNAEGMGTWGVSAIRAVVTYNGIESAIKPELEVVYNQGGILEPLIPTDVELYYDNLINVYNDANNLYVTSIHDGEWEEMPNVLSVYGGYEASYNVDASGMYHFWASSLFYIYDGDNELEDVVVHLGKAELIVYDYGTVSDNDNVIMTTIPDGTDYLYFQNVGNEMAPPEGIEFLSDQKAVTASPVQDLTLTMALNDLMDEGTVVGMHYDGDMWQLVAAVVDEDAMTATFEAESGHIYAVGQYTGVVIEAAFVSFDPQHIDNLNNYWTDADPEIKFFVYEGIDDNGYMAPEPGTFTYEMYISVPPLDHEVLIPDNDLTYDQGYVTYDAADLVHIHEYTVRLVVSKDGFVSEASRNFWADAAGPTIQPLASGGQLNHENRIIEAIIIDDGSGIADVQLTLTFVRGRTSSYSSIVVPLSNLMVNGDVYSYEVSYDDLIQLGYRFIDSYDLRETQILSATWEATDNVDYNTVADPAFYTVNIEGPIIHFTGFEDGWWLNPTANTPLTFDIIVPDGRIMPTDGVEITLIEVTQSDPTEPGDNIENMIQFMTLAPIGPPVDGVYSYELNFGYNISPQAIAVRLEVEATDNYEIKNYSEQTYGTDYVAPFAWALSPIGDIVDPEVHPPTYESAVVSYGTEVAIGVAYEDLAGFVVLETGEWWWDDEFPGWFWNEYMVYYTGGSGINTNVVAVYLNGHNIEEMPGANVDKNSGTYIANFDELLDPGEYNVIATVTDNAGNVASLSYSFTVVGGAPTITFNPVNGEEWWLNSTEHNEFSFEVESQNQLASGGIVANFYSVPANELIQGPMTPTPGTDETFSVHLQGGIVPANQTGVRLEVTATDVWGGTSTGNQVYGIDNYQPMITFHTPEDGAGFAYGHGVNITATVSDQAPTRALVSGPSRNTMSTARVASRDIGREVLQGTTTGITADRMRGDDDDRAGSGLIEVRLRVVKPSGEYAYNEFVHSDGVLPVIAISETINSMDLDEYGTYNINIVAKDRAHNTSVASISFQVVTTQTPAVTINPIEGWLSNTETNELTFQVDSADNNITASAKVYAIPSGDMIIEPTTISPNQNGVYIVNLHGSLIPELSTAVRLEVTATDSFGLVGQATRLFNVDNTPPEITVFTPESGTEITLIDAETTINIYAEFSTSGSGIASAKLRMTNPHNVVQTIAEVGAGSEEISAVVSDLSVGNYTVRLTVMDIAGNQVTESITFRVIPAPAEPEVLALGEAFVYPNPVDSETGATFRVEMNTAANVTIRIYDFAGNEVRVLDRNAHTGRSDYMEVVWDGRNNNGQKLARGAYFARIVANDGKKIVEKVVKVAIIK
jgi:hypothetical protein